MGLLGRLWLHRHVRESPEFTAHRRERLCPERLHTLKAFNETLPPTLAGDAKDRFGNVRSANSDANDDSTITQLIQRRQALGKLNRISNHRDQHPCSQTKFRGEG